MHSQQLLPSKLHRSHALHRVQCSGSRLTEIDWPAWLVGLKRVTWTSPPGAYNKKRNRDFGDQQDHGTRGRNSAEPQHNVTPREGSSNRTLATHPCSCLCLRKVLEYQWFCQLGCLSKAQRTPQQRPAAPRCDGLGFLSPAQSSVRVPQWFLCNSFNASLSRGLQVGPSIFRNWSVCNVPFRTRTCNAQ